MLKSEILGQWGEKRLIQYLLNLREYPKEWVFQVISDKSKPKFHTQYIISEKLQVSGVDALICRPFEESVDYSNSPEVSGYWVSLFQIDSKGREDNPYLGYSAYVEATIKRPKPIPGDFEAVIFSDFSVLIAPARKGKTKSNPYNRMQFIEGVGTVPYPQFSHGGPNRLGEPHSQCICDALLITHWDYPDCNLINEILIDKHLLFHLINQDREFYREFFILNRRKILSLYGLNEIGKDNFIEEKSNWMRRGILPSKSFRTINGKRVPRPGGVNLAVEKKLLNSFIGKYELVKSVYTKEGYISNHRPWKMTKFEVTMCRNGVSIPQTLLVKTGMLDNEIYIGAKIPGNLVVQRKK